MWLADWCLYWFRKPVCGWDDVRVSFLDLEMLIVSIYSDHIVRSRLARSTVASGLGISALFITCLQTLLSSELSAVVSCRLRIKLLFVSTSSCSVEFCLQE